MELCINNLTKQFKDKLAVDHVSLTITPGVWGLLGANGAGKTTLMRMAAGCEEKEDHKAFRRNETAGGHCPGSFKRPKGTDPG